MENVIMMVNNAGDVHQHKKKTQALQPVKIKSKAHAIDMRVMFHNYMNDILNDL